MKKLLLFVTCLLSSVIINAQPLNDIIKKYSAANMLDKVSGLKTVKVTAKMSVMGQDMTTEMWMKNPNKIKTVTDIGGQQMIQSFDGEKGWTLNPMTGSTDPIEMNPDQVKDILRNSVFQDYLANYLKDGLLTLVGEDTVKGKPAYNIKIALPGGTTSQVFIDKSSYLLAKTVADVNQGGNTMTVESFPSDYTVTDGIMLPMKTTSTVMGMDMVMTISKVEVDIPMEDSVFKLK